MKYPSLRFVLPLLVLIALGVVIASENGLLGIFIVPSQIIINIDSPLNVTYNFNVGSNYTLQLNVSSPLPLDAFWYTLEDLRHDEIVYQNILFTPNTTFNAVRWENKLTVYANNSLGEIGSTSVYFYVNVPDSAPVIDFIPDNAFACEAYPFSLAFNVTNLDEDVLDYDIFPRNPFFILNVGPPTGNIFKSSATIVSQELSKDNVGDHIETVVVDDGTFVDTDVINITVIEINEDPDLDTFGAITLYTIGENTEFHDVFDVFDVEDGNLSSGNLSLNVTFSGPILFNIGPNGEIDFTASSTYIGVHDIQVCTTDHALSVIHPNISICGETGLANTVCQSFSITVTGNNRPPVFTSNYPEGLTFVTPGKTDIYFNVTGYDPDGTIPSVRWFYDGVEKQFNSSIGNGSSYTYSIQCDEEGQHNVTSRLSDGFLHNDTIWRFNITKVSCDDGGGGGGDAEVGLSCIFTPGCEAWSNCQNLETAFGFDEINRNDYLVVKKNCTLLNLDEEECGFQKRGCIDIYSCNQKRDFFRQNTVCQYQNPTCFDGVKNCQGDNCELFIDCGGPCDLCKTCSDGIQNQGERGIDCGGPCPRTCEEEKALLEKEELKYTIFIILSILLLILIILLIINYLRILKIKNEVGELKWYQLMGIKAK